MVRFFSRISANKVLSGSKIEQIGCQNMLGKHCDQIQLKKTVASPLFANLTPLRKAVVGMLFVLEVYLHKSLRQP
jgi:hypothetical protein